MATIKDKRSNYVKFFCFTIISSPFGPLTTLAPSLWFLKSIFSCCPVKKSFIFSTLEAYYSRGSGSSANLKSSFLKLKVNLRPEVFVAREICYSFKANTFNDVVVFGNSLNPSPEIPLIR